MCEYLRLLIQKSLSQMNGGETPAMSERKDGSQKKKNGMRTALIAFGVIVLSMVFCTSSH